MIRRKGNGGIGRWGDRETKKIRGPGDQDIRASGRRNREIRISGDQAMKI